MTAANPQPRVTPAALRRTATGAAAPRRGGRPLAWVLSLLVALAGAVGLAPLAQAGACVGTSGVTVVVQSDAGTTISCAVGDPSSGFQALTMAGFGFDMVQRFPGALCRINGFPADQACVMMPPATAYWSYWQAPAGGSWSYSSAGAGSTNPAPGSVEGWRFGSGQAPSVAPPSVPAPAPQPPAPPAPAPVAPPPAPAPANPGGAGTTGTTGTTGTSGTGQGTATGTQSSGGAQSPSASPAASDSASPSASPASASPSTSAHGTKSAPATHDAAAPRDSASSSGTGLVAPLVGLALVLAFGGGAWWVSRRRRAEVDPLP